MQVYTRAYLTNEFEDYKDSDFEPLKGGELRDITRTIDILINGRKVYPPKIEKFLETTRDDPIATISIHRAPILGRKLLNALTIGKLNKSLRKTAYDELFHLRLNITLTSGKFLYVEKNQNLNIEDSWDGYTGDGQYRKVEGFPTISLFEAMEKTRGYMGNDRFFNYSARKSNCQDFVLSFLESNGVSNPSYREFIKQDIDSIFKENRWFEKIANLGTKTLANIQTVLMGGNMNMTDMI